MVELKVATIEEIQNEFKRREMIEKDKRIKDLFAEITVAYNTGKISSISKENKNTGTSVSTTAYYIFTK